MRGFFEAYMRGAPGNPDDARPTPEPTLMVPVPRPAEHARICANCLALAHLWSKPTAEDIELPVTHDRYAFFSFRCICTCGCPAILTTVGPPMGPQTPRSPDQGGEPMGS
jgi:hypothetical protein